MNSQKFMDDQLKEITDAFNEFRESIQTISNGYWALSTVDGLENFKNTENTTNYVAEAQKEIATKQAELAELEKKAQQSTLYEAEREEIEYQQQRLEAQIRDLNERVTTSQSFVNQSTKDLDDQFVQYRGQLRDTIKKFGEALGVKQTETGLESERIAEIKEMFNHRLREIEMAITFYKKKLASAKDRGSKEDNMHMLHDLVAEQKRINGLITNIDKMWSIYESLNKRYIKGNQNINVDNLLGFSEDFEDLAIFFNKDAEYDKIQVEFISRKDGSYALKITCGTITIDPYPVIDKTEDMNERTQRILDGFANYLCTKTNHNISDYVLSDVILKSDGKKLGEAPYTNVGAIADCVRSGKALDDLMSKKQSNPEPQAPVPDEPAQDEPSKADEPDAPDLDADIPVPPAPDAPTPDAPAPDQPQPGEPQQPAPAQDGPQQPNPTPDAPQAPTPDAPTPDAPQAPTPDAPAPEPMPIIDEIDQHALKVNARRNANAQMFSRASKILGVAAVGLGFAGATLGFGLAPAAVAGGVFLANIGVNLTQKVVENIKYSAMRRKFRKIARRVGDETGVLIEPVFDTERRDCGFVLVDEDGNQLTDEYLTTESLSQLPQGLDDTILTIFNEEFEKANSYRGLGTNAQTPKQIAYREFPKITFDAPKAAFNEFGGVKSRTELNGFQFDRERLIADMLHRTPNDGELDDVDPVDPDDLDNPVFDAQQPGDQQPAPAQDGPQQPDPAQDGPQQPDPVQDGPQQPDPVQDGPQQPGDQQPDPAQDGPQQPSPVPSAPQPAAPVTDLNPRVADLMGALDGQDAPAPDAPDAPNMDPTQYVVQVVDALLNVNGPDDIEFDNIATCLEQQIEGGHFTLDQAQGYIAELESRGLVDDIVKEQLTNIINANSEKLAANAQGRTLL